MLPKRQNLKLQLKKLRTLQFQAWATEISSGGKMIEHQNPALIHAGKFKNWDSDIHPIHVFGTAFRNSKVFLSTRNA